jgi:hypothetical protein
MTQRNVFMMLVSAALVVGCTQRGQETTTEPAADPAAIAAGKKYLLESEPAGPASVLDTRKQAKDGDDVVLVGRIAGSEKPFVPGRASFSVTDLSIQPCPDDEGCPTPWDCCCTPPDELRNATAQIKFVDDSGKTLNVGARELFGVKELSVVVVKGVANRDQQGNLTVIGKGLFARKKT